jgi:UDP-N-acetylmuramyl pentapeptide phosphotransferase/UDP-N-acetylglucosamine-1-phosphate transferase
MHTAVTPRGGGLAILCSLVVVELIMQLFSSSLLPNVYFAIGLASVAAISYIDDHRELSARIRVCVHFFAAACLVIPLGHGLVLSLLFMSIAVWCINLFNFMDGIDGLATCMAMVASLTFAVVLFDAGFISAAIACTALFCSCAGFLLLNLPPAKIFLGDVGSASLGFLMAYPIIFGVRFEDGQVDVTDSLLAMLVFAPFIVDATVTLLRRFLAGEKVYKAHRSHYYQRLALRVGPKKTLYAYLALMLACGITRILLWPQ